MTPLLRNLSVLGLMLLLGEIAGAHPGHGASEAGPTHYLSEPVHAVWLVIPGVAAGLIALAVAAHKRGARNLT